MDIDSVRNHCLSLPGTTEDLKWEHNLCFCIAGKIYCLLSLELPLSLSLKVAKQDFGDWTAQDGVRQAPYFARGQWVTIDDISQWQGQPLFLAIVQSYQLILDKLPARTRASVLGNDP